MITGPTIQTTNATSIAGLRRLCLCSYSVDSNRHHRLLPGAFNQHVDPESRGVEHLYSDDAITQISVSDPPTSARIPPAISRRTSPACAEPYKNHQAPARPFLAPLSRRVAGAGLESADQSAELEQSRAAQHGGRGGSYTYLQGT
jgi:hypothetical protein